MTDWWAYVFMAILVIVGGATVYFTGKRFEKERVDEESRAKVKNTKGEK